MPGALLLIARVSLAAVLAVAGVAKLLDRPGTREAARDFGLPSALWGPVALLLPLAELAIAAALLPARSAPYAALAAGALLVVFMAAIGAMLARGRAPDCRCFGRLHSSPAGWGTLARDGALAAVAGFVAVAGWGDAGPSGVAWTGEMDGATAAALAAAVLAAVAVAGGGAVVLHVLRSHGTLLLRVEALEHALARAGLAPDDAPGELEIAHARPAPGFALPAVGGGIVTLADLSEGERPVVLVFTDPACGPCRELAPAIARWQREHELALTIAVASAGADADAVAEARRHGVQRVLLDSDGSVADAYGAAGTPSAVLIAPDGWIRVPVAGGAVEIERLVERALDAAGSEPQGLPIGTPAPPIVLPDPHGGTVRLPPGDGRSTVLVFWDPACGFCEEMRDELLERERVAGDAAPRLVVVSSGEAADVRREGFIAVALDGDAAASEAYGAMGTPSAVLIDERGHIASRLALGRDEVLELADGLAPSAA